MPRSGAGKSPGSGPPPCRRASRGPCGTLWRWGIWTSRSSGRTIRCWDSQVPVRQILEQLVARTGIPPFLLGLSWSSTERMSAQQADLMTSEITALAPDPGAGGGAHL